MTDSVLLIAKSEGFMVNAIKAKLEADGFMCNFCSIDTANINQRID